MSHVDDGTIQAYLDHQLEFTEPEARRAFEQHLANHPDDAARVEAAQAIRERAIGLLAQRDAGIEDIPPFEAVQQRARATSNRNVQITKLRTIRTLGLAASVAAVFAVGWWLRPSLTTDHAARVSTVNEAEPPRANEPAPETPSQAPRLEDADRQAVAVPSPTDDRAGVAEAERDVVAGQAADAAAAPVVSGARKATEEAQQLRQQQTQVSGVTAGRGVAAPPPAAQRARRVAGEAVALDEVAAERREAQVNPDSLAGELATRDSLRLAARQPLEVFRQVTAVDAFADLNAPGVAAGAAAPGHPILAIDGLPIERVDTAFPGGIVAVTVLQRLASGAAVGLLQTPTLAENANRQDTSRAALLERLAGYPRVVVGGWLVIGVADLPWDSLEALLGDLREAPRTN